jgi:hypothetical protein
VHPQRLGREFRTAARVWVSTTALAPAARGVRTNTVPTLVLLSDFGAILFAVRKKI